MDGIQAMVKQAIQITKLFNCQVFNTSLGELKTV